MTCEEAKREMMFAKRNVIADSWIDQAYDKAIEALSQPERKTGEWIDKGIIQDYPEKGFNNYHLLVCNRCGCMYRTNKHCETGEYLNADFCPKCGADMRG